MLLAKEKIQLLSMVDVLEPLSREQIEEVLRQIPDAHFEQGQILYAPEDRSEALFLLKRGRVRIYKLDRDGREFTLDAVEAGTIFGEMALTAQRLWGAYAEATEPTDVCILKSRDVERLVREHPDVGLKMIRVLSERLRLCENRLEDIGLKSVPARLASLVLQLAESEGIMTTEGPKIPTHYTHWQLAAMIGASRVSVTKAFAQLQDAGAVELKRRHIYLKDVEALERAARK
ncbi:MAG: Crp/Fnr family transcriptional regulator [Actinomycetota bacterium]|nr:Crp/Fnr family transcriptional regulator [Actinomycetota bacterium]